MATFSTAMARSGDTTIVNLSGELDIATVPELRPVAIEELDRDGCTTLVFDLSELSFLDSTGIGCWVELRSYAIERGKQVTIRNVPPAVRRVLEIGGLLALFDAAPPTSD